jgi:hypothetical protein
MRTLKEIQAHIKEIKHADFFSIETADLGTYLHLSMLREIGIGMSDDFEPDQWSESTPERVKQILIDYLDFAIGKGEDHRGLSAERSIAHMRAWLWLIEDDELYQFASNTANYRNYGAPILLAISRKYRPKFNDFSEGFLNMAKGRRCQPGCSEGCSNKPGEPGKE